jgi:hypothetical protein
MKIKRILIEFNIEQPDNYYCVGKIKVMDDDKEKTLHLQKSIKVNDFQEKFAVVWDAIGKELKRMVVDGK